MPYRRIQVKSAVRLLLVEVQGTPGFGEDFLLDQAVSDAADEVARRTHTFYADKIGALDGSETPYHRLCVPELYRITSAVATLADGSQRVLQPRTLRWMNERAPGWQERPAVGDPEVYVYATPWVYLYPRPDYTEPDGIVFSGYGVPGASWPTDDHWFPLPDRCYAAVVLRAAATRCIQFPTPENLARLPLLERRYAETLSQIGVEETTQRDAGRTEGVSLL